jgi:hypothetical protein
VADLLADELADDVDAAVQLQHLEPSTSEMDSEDHTDPGTDCQDSDMDILVETAKDTMVVECSG